MLIYMSELNQRSIRVITQQFAQLFNEHLHCCKPTLSSERLAQVRITEEYDLILDKSTICYEWQ